MIYGCWSLSALLHLYCKGTNFFVKFVFGIALKAYQVKICYCMQMQFTRNNFKAASAQSCRTVSPHVIISESMRQYTSGFISDTEI